MTSPPGGRPRSRHASHSPSPSRRRSDSNNAPDSMRQQHAAEPLERRLGNVVAVQQASRLVESAQVERQLGFQHLVRSYLSQILYGCINPACTTPTCLSCNKRLHARPFRAPTQLTARALAHFLASQEHPAIGLCPHALKVPPSTLQLQFGNTDTGLSSSTQHQHDHQKLLDSINERRQKKKDVKSLAQNLYDTSTVIFSYSRYIPTPSYLFSTLHASPATVSQYVKDSSASAPAAASANGQYATTVAVESAAVAHESRQNSQHGTVLSQQIDSSMRQDNQSVHKIRHRPLDNAPSGHSLAKPADSFSLDGTGDPTLFPPATVKKPSVERPSHIKLDSAVIYPRLNNPAKAALGGDEAGSRALPVASYLTCEIMELLKEEISRNGDEQSSAFNPVVDYDSNRSIRPTKLFVNRTIFFTLSDPDTLLLSFRETGDSAYKNSPLPHLDATRLTHAFRDWNQRNGALIFDSLWKALEVLFVPPPELATQKSPRLRTARRSPSLDESSRQASTSQSVEESPHRYLDDEEAAHIIMICIHALTSSISVGWPETWVQLRKFRSWGIILPGPPSRAEYSEEFSDPWLDIIDQLEYEPALRLVDRLLRAIGARSAFACILSTLEREAGRSEEPVSIAESRFLNLMVKHLAEVERMAVSKKKKKSTVTYRDDPGWTVTATFMEWLRTIIIKQWDGKGDVNKWSSVGTAVRFFNVFHAECQKLNLRMHMFYMPYFNERLDPVDTPSEFLSRDTRPNHFHLLQFRHLFPPEYLVGYFRTINFTTMFNNYARTDKLTQLQREFNPFYSKGYYWSRIRDLMKVSISDYLVLDVSRANTLQQTLDQLWRKEQRALLKPLKVKMGIEGGELGLDQGGVTFEFFRVILDEAFNPSTGMFTTDSQTRMTWFQPASLEPLWKFEMLGRLFSLAVYNGITLPVTFPVSLYFNLLAIDRRTEPQEYPAHTDFIRDGWPTLARSFNTLLTWKEGDVSDMLMRSYAFSFEAYGCKVDVDMQAFQNHPTFHHRIWPSNSEAIVTGPLTKGPFGCTWGPDTPHPELGSSGWERPGPETYSAEDVKREAPGSGYSMETPMVTNANRSRFVADYIYWLTYVSVAPQLLAFRKGFRTCLQEKSLNLFDAASLKALVEGTQNISVPALRAASRYENGYSTNHNTIVEFWAIVEDYDMDDRRKLLEFVTASERIPVTGFENMNFSIVKAGPDTEMLPTSSTCFGKLMLPEYKTKEKLKRKLDLAIQNSKGFGVV